jgi:hypothetical protein
MYNLQIMHADLFIQQYGIELALGLVTILLVVSITRLEMRLRRLTAGKDGVSLEHSIADAHEALAKLKEFQNDSVSYFTEVEERLGRSIQAVETVRFNPFKGTGEGGYQSFSTAFVSEKGDGVVLSSLYSRERISVFSKPLEKFQSQFDLTEEEKEVLDSAKKNLSA